MMKHTVILLFVIGLCVGNANAALDWSRVQNWSLAFPSIEETSGTNKVITDSFGTVRSGHFHGGIDLGVNNAKVVAAYSGWMGAPVESGDNSYVDIINYGTFTPNSGVEPIFTMRYIHCEPRTGYGTGSSIDMGVNCIVPLQISAPHCHFEVIKRSNGINWNGNPMYNDLWIFQHGYWDAFTYRWIWQDIMDGFVVDLFQYGVNGGSSTVRQNIPVTDGSIDHYGLNWGNVDFQTTENVNGVPIVRGNSGPIVTVGDTGINGARSSHLNIFRIDCYHRKNYAQLNHEFAFTVRFDYFQHTEAIRSRVEDVFDGSPENNGDLNIYMYKRYAGDPLTFHMNNPNNFSNAPEGRNTYQFIGLGYEDAPSYKYNDGSSSGTQVQSYSTPDFQVIVDNNQNPQLNSVNFYQPRLSGNDYVWTEIAGTSNDPLYSGSPTRISICLSEDSIVSTSTTIFINSMTVASTNCQVDYSSYVMNGENYEYDESKWLLEYPATNASGIADFNVHATDLAGNTVSVGTPIQMHFTSRTNTKYWRRYE